RAPMAARRAGCIAKVGRHSSPRTDTACPSGSGSHKPSISCLRWASSSRSRRRAPTLLRHPNRLRQSMSNDLDELPEIFDPSAHEGTDLKPIPPGWYQAQITETSVQTAQNGNGTYLLAVFEILGSEYKGRRVYQNITLQNVNQQAVEI